MFKAVRIFIGAITAFSIQTSYANLLVNGSFESGDLMGWNASGGTGIVVKSSRSMNPSTPFDGSYLFSASSADGAVRGSSQKISISQLVSMSDSFQTIDAGGYFSGAAGIGNASNDLVMLTLSFFSSGELLQAISTPQIDPIVGSWNHLILKHIVVPTGSTHAMLEVSTFLDPGFSSIDIGIDGLFVSAVPEPSGTLLTAVGAAVIVLMRRSVAKIKNA